MAKKQHGGSRPGAGRRPAYSEGKTVTVAASVPESLVERLDALAAKRGWNRSQAITEAVRRIVRR